MDLDLLCYVAAFFCFLAAAFGGVKKIEIWPLGWAFLVLSLII